ncbi:MAG: RNA pseudouridine synthase, partial [Candidatus Aureabacteria bacterium]|nr:RNA pseudouridine synthase [Candidatus Auribacterota bacterium]
MNKPSGLLIVPGRGDEEAPTLREVVESRLPGKVWVVHRLDRETSGAVIFAKTPEAHRFLNRRFELRQVRKTYLALAEGDIGCDGTLRMPVREFGSGRMGVGRRGGKPSVTRYRVKERLPGCTLLEVSPETGRRHQIRVHLYAIGHPVMGDPIYGADRPVGGVARLMLHALSLSFTHPEGPEMTVEAPPGEDWESVLRSKRSPPPPPPKNNYELREFRELTPSASPPLKDNYELR